MEGKTGFMTQRNLYRDKDTLPFYSSALRNFIYKLQSNVS